MRRSPSLFSGSVLQKLLVSVIPISLIGIFLTGFFAYHLTRPFLINNITKEVHSLGFEGAQNVSVFFKQRLNDLETLSESPLFVDHYKNVEFGLRREAATYKKGIQSYLERFSERTGVYHGIFYLDKNDDVLTAVLNAPVDHKKGELFEINSPHFVVDESFGPLVYYKKYLQSESGQRMGSLVLATNLSPIQDILGRLQIGHSGISYLVDSFKRPILSPVHGSNVHALGGEYLVSDYIDVLGTPWKVAFLVDLNNFLTPLNTIKFMTTTLIVVCGLLVIVLITYRTRILIKPVQRLKQAADQFSKGNLSERVNVTTTDEVGALSESFNTMAGSLQELVEKIRQSEVKYRTTLDSTMDAIMGLDAEFKITTWNRGAQTMFGYSAEEAIGKSLSSLFPQPHYEILMDVVNRNGFVQDHEITGLMKDGKRIHLSLNLAGAGNSTKEAERSVVIRNISEQKKLQTQLIQAEKLSVVGQLVSGVAHEINNPLTAVVGYSELLASSDNFDEKELKEDVQLIYESAVRCREIVANLLRFARKGELYKRAVNVNEVIRVVLKLMEYRIVKKESVQLECHLDTKVPLVCGDFQQLEQVLINLLHNACDAMGTQGFPRRITIETKFKDPSVHIYVSDNGPGIPEQFRDKVFEPFFTSKPEGKGTGLGLAISKQIMRDHAGDLTVDSTSDRGTTFAIKLPKLKGSEVSVPKPADQLPPVSGKRVLVIDDEAELIPLMRHVLIDEGHSVETASSGQEGIQKLKRYSFDLVVSDVELGDMKGIAIGDVVQKMEKKPKLIFITGDVLNTTLIAELRKEGIPYLSKPFGLNNFRKLVRKVLSTGEAKSPSYHLSEVPYY